MPCTESFLQILDKVVFLLCPSAVLRGGGPEEYTGRWQITRIRSTYTTTARLSDCYRAGDEKCFDALFRRYYKPLCTYATRHEALGVGAERFVIAAEKRIENVSSQRRKNKQPCGWPTCCRSYARSVIGRSILRARRPKGQRRRGQSKNRLYPIFPKKIPVQGIQYTPNGVCEGNRGTGAGNAVSQRQGRRRPGTAALSAASEAPSPPGTRHGTGVGAEHGACHGGKPDIPGLCPEIATAEREYRRILLPLRCRSALSLPAVGRERKVRATQSAAQANDLISVRV